jgi:hypothetical protein
MFAIVYPWARKSTAFVLAVSLALGTFLMLPHEALALPNSSVAVSTVAQFTAGATLSNTTITDVGAGDGSVTNTATEALDQTQATGATARTFGATTWLSQVFTPSQSGLLSKVDLRIRRQVADDSSGDVTVEIRDTSAGAPGSTVLATTSLLSTAFPTGIQTVTFTFATPTVITAGTQYAIVAHRGGTADTDSYDWYRENNGATDDYAGGAGYQSTDSGTTWPTTLTNDLRFNQYYTVYATSGSYVSGVFDTGTLGTSFKQLAWNGTYPASTGLTFEVRASGSPFLAGDVSPAWVTLPTTSPVNLSTYLSGTYRYYQQRITFTGTTTATPTLTDFTLSYNLPPVQNAIGSKVVDELNTLTFTASASDTENDTLSWSLSGEPTGATIDFAGVFTWTPTEAQGALSSNSYTFDVIANDGQGGTDTKTVNVTVNEVNIAPVAVGSTDTTNEDTLKTVTMTGTDADLPANGLTYSIVNGPTNGSLGTITGDQVDYTPDLNYNGPDQFSFQVFDGTVLSPTATISLTIDAVNDAPVANDVVDITNEDIPKTITFSATDLEGNGLTYSIVSGPTNGSLGTISGNTVVYTPNLNFNGADSFTYQVTDNGTPLAATSNTATVTIGVTSVNDAPVLTAIPSQIVDEQTLLTFTATATDPEVPASQSLSYAFSIPAAPAGAAIDSVSGVFTWTPTEAQGPSGYSFMVMVSDNASTPGTSAQIVNVTVDEVNIAPVATNVSTSINLATPITITLPATDVDLPANTLTYSIVSGPASGSLGIVTGNQVTYTPTVTNWGGLDSFTFKVNDGTVDSNVATVNVTITAPAQANPGAGAYTWVQYVALTRQNSSSIVYTVDGTTPNCTGTGTTYTVPVRISRTKDLKAIACYAGGFASPVTTWHYDIDIHATPAQIPQLFTDLVFVPVGPATAATSVTSTEKVTLDFTNGGGSSTIVIPQDTVMTPTAGGTFDGTAITVADEIGATFGNFPINPTPSVTNTRYVALLLGINNTDLTFDQPLDFTLWSETSRVGATLKLLRSTDRMTSWDTAGFAMTTCFVQPTAYCNFQTTQSGHIALYLPSPEIGGTGSGGSNGGVAFVTPTPSPNGTAVAVASPTPTPSTSVAPTASPVPTSIVAGAETSPTPTPVTSTQVAVASATPRPARNTGSGIAAATPKPSSSSGSGSQIAKASPTPTSNADKSISIGKNTADAADLSQQSAAILGMSKKSAAAVVGFAVAVILGFAFLRKRFW